MWNKVLPKLGARTRVSFRYFATAIFFLSASSCQFVEINRLSTSAAFSTTTLASLAWSPLSNSFGNVRLTTNSATQIFTLTNSGTGDATGCSAPTLSNTTDFTIVTDLCSTNDLAYAGATCAVEVRANPTTNGAKTATLSRTCSVGGTVTTTANLITTTGYTRTLAFKTQPTNTVAGVSISPHIEVQAEISSGVVDTSFTGAVTLSLGGASDLLGTLSGTLTETAVAGVATFNTGAPSIEYAATNYTLKATAAGAITVTSNTFSVTPSTMTQLAFGNHATDRPTGACMGPFTVTGKDSFGNPSPIALTYAFDLELVGNSFPPTFYTASDCSAGIVTTIPIQAGNIESDPFYLRMGNADTFTVRVYDGTGPVTDAQSPTITVNDLVPDTWVANTAIDTLSPRYAASAVWTGSEIIFWGGGDITGDTNTGARYNPTSDSWVSATSTTGAPSARTSHSAIWTGTEMIVWGGAINTTPENTGGRYNPVTDTWGTATSTVGAPAGRFRHVAVWTGTEMIVWGGIDTTFARVSTGKKYDPATDTWGSVVSTTDAPSARELATAVWTGTEMVVWGGLTPAITNTGGRYNPATDNWGTATSTVSAPLGRYMHSAIWTGSEMIIWGGIDSAFATVDTSVRYNPVTDTWGTTLTTPGAPSARSFHTATWTGTEMIVWGGTDITGYYARSGGRYSPATDTWGSSISNSDAPRGRQAHTAIWTGTEMIIWGGASTDSANSGDELNTGKRYNPSTNAWGADTSTTGAPLGRHHHTAIWTGTEMIVWGGSDGSASPLTDGGRYDPATDTWGTAPSTAGAPIGVVYHSAIWAGTEMIIFGGADINGIETDTGGRYDPGSDTWAAIASAATPRSGHSAVWTGSKMIIWGGGTYLNTGEIYVPGIDTWSGPTATLGAPTARKNHSAVWTGSEMIIWGGYDVGGDVNSGGRYEPISDTWGTATTTTGAPSVRQSHSAIWTGTEMIIWGGYNQSVAPTGVWNTGAFYVP